MADVLALALMLLGAVLTLIASIGLIRFPDVLSRMHAASKPQTLGLVLIVLGMAVAVRTVEGACIALLVLLAQMATAPASSTLLARAAFRRGFVRGGQYAVDELSPRLMRADADDADDRLRGDEDDADEPGAPAADTAPNADERPASS